jgi:hypothetical protein
MRYLKKVLLSSAIFLTCNVCFAQSNAKDDYGKFARSFSSIIDYPIELIRNCMPVFCLIKVQVDSAKNILDMKLSDSADPTMIKEFNNHKHSLDIKLLKNYLDIEYANNSCTTYLIPLSYGLRQMPCPQQSVSISVLNACFKFDGKYADGNVILLEPIGALESIQR